MYLAAFLIGLREGLEASLIIGILIAYVHKAGRSETRKNIWTGVGLAVLLTVVLGATFTFGRYVLTFQGQEILGGSLSLLAVAMVTWMVFKMVTVSSNIKGELEESSGKALLAGSAWAMFWLSFISVGREGTEMTLMLWGWLIEPLALFGALSGIAVAVGLGFLIYRQALRINYAKFFAWMGAFLIIVVAGILAYGIHDLQEAAVLPGPFSGAPITPTDVRTGEVLTGFTNNPFWLAAYPFGWAFDFTNSIDPTGFAAALLKGTVGFVPQMSWLEVTAWALYLVIVFPRFIRLAVRHARRRPRPTSTPTVAAPSTQDVSPTHAEVLSASATETEENSDVVALLDTLSDLPATAESEPRPLAATAAPRSN